MTIVRLPSDSAPLSEAIDWRAIDPAEREELEHQAELRRQLLAEVRSVMASVLGSDLGIQVLLAICNHDLKPAQIARWRVMHRSSVCREVRRLRKSLEVDIKELLRNKPDEIVRLLRMLPDDL